MKSMRFLIPILLLAMIGSDVYGQTFQWKKKEDKVALYYKPDKGKGRLVTDYLYDPNCEEMFTAKGKPRVWCRLRGDHVFAVKTDTGYGLINGVGQSLIPCKYAVAPKVTMLREVHDRTGWWVYFMVTAADGKHELCAYGSEGVCILEGKYDEVRVLQDRLLFVRQGNRVGIVGYTDKKLSFSLPCIYDRITPLKRKFTFTIDAKESRWVSSQSDTDLLLVQLGDKCGIYEMSSRRLIFGVVYDLASFRHQEWMEIPKIEGDHQIFVIYHDPERGSRPYLMLRRDGMTCIVDWLSQREIYTHKTREQERFPPFDFLCNGVGDIYYISQGEDHNTTYFVHNLRNGSHINCTTEWDMKTPFLPVESEDRVDCWLVTDTKGMYGLYNSDLKQMILPIAYKEIRPDKNNGQLFTVIDPDGNRKRAFITRNRDEVVLFDGKEELLKRCKRVGKVGQFEIIEYKDGRGVYAPLTGAYTSVNFDSVVELGKLVQDVPAQMAALLVTSQGKKIGLISNGSIYHCLYNHLSVKENTIYLTYDQWLQRAEYASGKTFFNTTSRISAYTQQLTVQPDGTEQSDDNMAEFVMKWGEDAGLKRDIATLEYNLRNKNIGKRYRLMVPAWYIKRQQFKTAIARYESVKKEVGKVAAPAIDRMIAQLQQLQIQKEENERIEREERERERQLAELAAREAELERQREYERQRQAAEAARQQRREALIQMLAVAGKVANDVNNAVQQYAYPNRSTITITQQQTTNNYHVSAGATSGTSAANASDIRHCRTYYNKYEEHAQHYIKRIAEENAWLKVNKETSNHIEYRQHLQSRTSAQQSLQRIVGELRNYRERAARLGGNIPKGSIEMQAEQALR